MNPCRPVYTLFSVIVFVLMTQGVDAQIYKAVTTVSPSNSYSDYLSFEVETQKIEQLRRQKSSDLQIQIPFFNSGQLSLELDLIHIHAEGFQLKEKSHSRERVISYELGTYYNGKVIGYEDSRALIAFHENELSAVIVYKGQTYNLGKEMHTDRHRLARAEDVDGSMNLKCATTTEGFEKPAKQTFKRRTSCSAYIDVYFECDYQMYQNFGSNATTVTNYVNTMFAEVNTLYNNETVNIQISEIVVWTSNDGYANGTAGVSDFAQALSSGFNGDLAHLLTNDTGSNGGVAYVNQLCGNFPFAYSDIVNSSSVFPAYSWDVQVVAHEMGHNLGSVHTHDCAWGPNNDQQIDDCGSIATSGGSCFNPASPIVPASGGTIMSYCHLNAVGINFNNGFGQEPGNLIRSNYSSCMCDNATCAEASELTGSGTYTARPDAGSGASSSSATHADWFLFTPTESGTIDVFSCNEGRDTRLHIHSGNCNNLSFVATSDDDCTSQGNLNYASQVLGLSVSAGTNYYIEWDNRWSTALFNWTFSFTPSGTGNSVDISCPSNFVGLNSCNSSDYDPSLTGQAVSTTTGASITYSDNISTATCSVDVVRTWVATTVTGDSSSCVQDISLNDSDAPIIGFCPANITVSANAACTATVSWTNPFATDACTMVNEVSNFNSGHSFQVGTEIIQYSFFDLCGNVSFCNFNVTVLSNGCSNASLDDCDAQHVLLNNTIATDTYNAELTLQAAGIVQPNTNPVFKAGVEMTLSPGFEVPLGSTLEASIENCNN